MSTAHEKIEASFLPKATSLYEKKRDIFAGSSNRALDSPAATRRKVVGSIYDVIGFIN
jgi:hypothetical protein